jgi:MFS superfamily sulfate permease-like transporter
MTTATSLRAADWIAGLSIAGLLLPEAVAYSGVAGLPPQAGVIALIAGLVCYGAIGRSRYAIVSATSSSAAVLASATLALGGGDVAQRIALAGILVIAAGVAFLLVGSLRLGAMSNLIARPVLRGYAFGLAIVIAVKQWPRLVDLPAQSTSFFPLLIELARRVDEWKVLSLACGSIALAALFAFDRVRRVPGALVVIVAGIAASPWLQTQGIALTGTIRLALEWPSFALPANDQWLPLIGFALALMFVLYAESYSSIRTYALKHDDKVRPNRDLIALGVANVVAGLLQGTPVGAGYSATSANEAAGAQSRLAGLVAAMVVLLLVLSLLPFIERIPVPVLAAIVIHAVGHSLRIGTFHDYFLWRRDRLVALAAVITVMWFGILNGLLAAIVFSVIMLLRTLANPRLAELGRVGEHDYVSLKHFPHALEAPGILVLRPEVPLFFANAEPLFAQARRIARQRQGAKLIVLSLEESPDLDSTAIESLREFCAWLRERETALRVARLKDLAREALARANLDQLPAATALDYSSVDDAVSGRSVSRGARD